MAGIEKNLTGDSLTFMLGPRWTPLVSGRLVPYAQVLFGGNRLTQELISPQKEASLEALAKSAGSSLPDRSQYVQKLEPPAGFAMAAGAGLDLHFNGALAFRIFSGEYTRSWVTDLNGFGTPHGMQFKTGLVLRMGTW